MVLYGILVALSAVIVGVYAVWNLTVRPPEIPQEPDPAPPAGSGSQAAEPVEQEQPAGRQRREDVYNFVLLGRDRESANTDTIIVVSYDVANQKVGMISIPRDTAVNRDWRKDPKINGAYAGAGVDVLKEEIEQTFGIPIDYYIYVDLKGFVALVDELAHKAAEKVKGLTEAPTQAVEVEGCDPIRPYYTPRDRHGEPIKDFLKAKPVTDPDKCVKCGLCARLCPMGSIDPADVSNVAGKCIKCCACVKKCPTGAKYFDHEGYLYHQHELEDQYAGRRAPSEIFV